MQHNKAKCSTKVDIGVIRMHRLRWGKILGASGCMSPNEVWWRREDETIHN